MNTHNRNAFTLLLGGLLLGAVLPASAQICQPTNIRETTSSMQYLDNQDGTVTDIRTSLVWQKCVYGQTYDAATGGCTDNPLNLMDWGNALKTAGTANTARLYGKTGWRVPNLKELASLIEYSCSAPAIRLSVFPGTPSNIFWTSTPDGEVHPEVPGRIVDFTDGTEYTMDVNKARYVRLVRDVQQ